MVFPTNWGEIKLVGEIYTGTKCCMTCFEVKTGVRQGCILSPLLFNSFLDRTLKEVLSEVRVGMHVEYSSGGGLFLSYQDKTSASAHIQDAKYADDMDLVAESRSEMQCMVKVLSKVLYVSSGACDTTITAC